MASKDSMPSLDFKRGDDFKLDLTVQDTNNAISLGLLSDLNLAKAALEATIEADPLNTGAIQTAQNAVDAAQIAYDASIVVDITGWTMKSQVRHAKKLISELDITVVDAANGIFTLSKDDLDTVSWPIRSLTCDVEFVRPEGKVSSETFLVNVIEDQTI